MVGATRMLDVRLDMDTAMSETPILKEIQLDLSHGDVRLWRNNRGQAWQGNVVTDHTRGDHTLTLAHPRVVHFGLADGSSDLIGFRAIRITPEMVGQSFAVFVSIEVKATRRSKFQKSQKPWLSMVQEFGGIAGIARSVDDARRIIYSENNDV